MAMQPAVEVGPFQEFADAMLRGCAATRPSVRGGRHCSLYENGVMVEACAYYALLEGLGDWEHPRWQAMWDAYSRTYDSNIVSDYEQIGLTREQIAARIAALR